MTDQQKSNRDKAKQAWIDLHKGLDYIQGREDFKLSIKRDIEKRIAELEKPIEFDLDEEVLEYMRYYSKIQIEECKRFLELIETVEP